MKNLLKVYRFYILAIAFLVMGLIAYYFQGFRSEVSGERNFQLDRNKEVVRIVLDDDVGEGIQLEKTEEGWFLNNQFSANEPAVHDLLATLRNLIVRYPVPVAHREEVKESFENAGIEVEVYVRSYLIRLPGHRGLFSRERLEKSIIVGDDTPDSESTYMILRGAENPYVVQVPGLAGGLREVFLPLEHLWRDRILLDLIAAQIRNVNVTWYETPNESFVILNDNSLPQLISASDDQPVEQEFINNQRVHQYLTGFTGLYFEQLITQQNWHLHDEKIFSTPFMQIVITDQSDNTTSFTFYRRTPSEESLIGNDEVKFDPNRFYIRTEEGQYALAQYFVFGRLMRGISFFIDNGEG